MQFSKMLVNSLQCWPYFPVPVCKVEHLPQTRCFLQGHNRMPGIRMGTEMDTLLADGVPAGLTIGAESLFSMEGTWMVHLLQLLCSNINDKV